MSTLRATRQIIKQCSTLALHQGRSQMLLGVVDGIRITRRGIVPRWKWRRQPPRCDEAAATRPKYEATTQSFHGVRIACCRSHCQLHGKLTFNINLPGTRTLSQKPLLKMLSIDSIPIPSSDVGRVAMVGGNVDISATGPISLVK
jgi:hypothetical protein